MKSRDSLRVVIRNLHTHKITSIYNNNRQIRVDL